MVQPLVVILVAFFLGLLSVSLFLFNRYASIHGSMTHKPVPDDCHVVISGGSKGIGKALATRYAQLGANVTIIARSLPDLEQAKRDIERARRRPQKQRINIVSLDLTRLTYPKTTSDKFTGNQQKQVNDILGPTKRCDILIHCCGNSIPGRFEDLSQDDFSYMMHINYFSAVNLTRLLLPSMKAHSKKIKKAEKGSQIVFISSICGLLSFYGYSAYSASKFALVGLAQALNMELYNHNMSVTIAFPGDTHTPGFEAENIIKPLVTRRISESGAIFEPEDVADGIITDVTNRYFYSSYGIENLAVLSTLNAFMPHSLFDAVSYAVMTPPLRILSYMILRNWYGIVKSEGQ